MLRPPRRSLLKLALAHNGSLLAEDAIINISPYRHFELSRLRIMSRPHPRQRSDVAPLVRPQRRDTTDMRLSPPAIYSMNPMGKSC